MRRLSPDLIGTILHLSDLHCGPPFDRSMATSLLKSLPAFRPDLIAVTGDLADSPRSRYYRSALLYLRELQSALAQPDGTKPKLVVIPGNHDYKLFGIFPWLLSVRFNVYFGEWSDQRDPLKLTHRLARYASLMNTWRKNLFDKRPWNTGSPAYPLCATGAGSVIVGYDSNWTRLLATGNIEPSEIRDTAAVLRPHITEDPLAVRIALLHHHPLPIPYSDHPGITDMEAFLVMQNSGTFMHQMVENDFDIILHGHKHFNCFSTISYQTGPDHQSQIAVLGAGTATKKGGNHEGKNSFNIIRVFRGGRAEIQMMECGASFGPRPAAEAPAPLRLHTRDTWKERAYRRNASAHHITVEKVSLTKEVLEDGRSQSIL